MPRKKQVALAEMKVGILVTVSLFLLAILILQQSWDVRLFSPTVRAITYLPDVGGLKPGAPVWLAGIEIGKVRKVAIVPPEIFAGNAPLMRQIDGIKKELDSLDPGAPNAKPIAADLQERIRDLKVDIRIVQVELEIQQQYLNRISRDSEVGIESRGLIGDSFIELSAGTYGDPPPKRDDFYVIEGVRSTGFREIMTGANDVVANFGVLSEQFKNIALKIDPDRVGEGFAQTIKDARQTLLQAHQTFERASLLTEDLRTGKGTFGKFVSDPSVYDRLAESLQQFKEIANSIQNGSGTLAKLIQDPSLYDSASETLRRAAVVMDRIEKGEGTLGRLSKDPGFYDTSKQAIDRFASLVDRIERGDGTMGRLLQDPSLYNNLDQSTAEITKLIYDLRQDPRKYLTIRFRLF